MAVTETIQELLQGIDDAQYGRDMRQYIHKGIQKCYEEGSAGETDLTARQAIQDMLGNFATVETSSTASRAYEVGENLVYDSVMYKVTTAIAQGGTITPGTNVQATTVAAACDKAVTEATAVAEEAMETAGAVIGAFDILNITQETLTPNQWIQKTSEGAYYCVAAKANGAYGSAAAISGSNGYSGTTWSCTSALSNEMAITSWIYIPADVVFYVYTSLYNGATGSAALRKAPALTV